MSPPLHIVIDPILLCLHNACASKEEFENFAKRLQSWMEVIDEKAATILVSERCVSALISTAAYPFTHTINDAIIKYELSHISADFLDRISQVLLEQRPWFEDAIDTDDVDANYDETVILPHNFLQRLNSKTQNAFRQALVAAAHWTANTEKDFDLYIGTSPNADESTSSISITSAIGIISRRNGELHEYNPAKSISEEIECVFDCNSILEARDAIAIWSAACTPEAVCSAISFRVKSHQMKGLNSSLGVSCVHFIDPIEAGKSLVESGKPYLMWTIGAKFMDSIHTWNFGNIDSQAELLIDACARILLDKPKQEVKPFRESNGSKEQLIRVDGATGWRTHLSKSGVAYRLMYWRLKSGIVEFANVANKWEEKIY